MRWIICILVGLALGYAVGVLAGFVLTALLSGNTHDKSLEMAMTSFFVTGPIGAILGVIVAIVRGFASKRARAST